MDKLVPMKRITLYLLTFLCFAVSQTACAENRRITLQDGTEIVGELLALKNGSYTIRSKTLGTLTVSERQVASISSLGHGKSSQKSPVQSAATALQGGQMESIQQSLLNDSTMVQRIMQLQSNPDIQAVLSDPEVMAAIQSLDFDTLTNHPKIKKLMANREIQAISKGAN